MPLDETELTALAVGLKAAADEVKRQGETAQAEMVRIGTLTAETKAAADAALIAHNAISARLTEIEQRVVRGAGQPEARKTLGATVTDGNEAAISALAKGRGRFAVAVKAIISALTTDADGSSGDLIVPQRLGLVAPVVRRMTVRDLLTPGRTASNALQYPQETGFTNMAATVSEVLGLAKPQSEIKFDIRTTSVTTIAHWVLATKQTLDDIPMLQSYINGRLLYGLMYVEEGQLLNGGGTGTDLLGINTQATAFVAPIALSALEITKIDVLRLSMLQATLAELPASGIVLNPADWADIELTKTTEGAYLFANPQGTSQPRLWGLPVVETQAMAIDHFLTGAFQMGAQIFDREDANVEVSTEDSDNFRKNLVTIRAEERLGLATYRPEAFIKGDFTTALA